MVSGMILGLALVSAPQVWTVMTFEGSASIQEDRETFRVLLAHALEDEGVRVRQSDDEPCGVPSCAVGEGEAIVVGSLRRYGEKYLIAAYLVPAGASEAKRNAQMTVDTLGDLDAVAKRMAFSLVEGIDTKYTGEVGTITQLETRKDRKRRGDGGFTVKLGGHIPFDDTYGGSKGGFGFDLGYWYETRAFAIESTIGLGFSADTTGNSRYWEVPLDVGAYWIPTRGDIAPFIGGGGGLRWLWEKRRGPVQVGEVITTVHQGELVDDQFAPALFARAGILLARTYTVHLSISGGYSVTFAELNGRGFAQAALAQLQIHF